ncbi:hypothetical protein Syun_009695 [Stephania yunnanensis]|uniref:Uncharacterized protein n=1 Tax=Stephania yunnanensis TaxID=152371 RepID=A0AAP0KEY1_9MAGN
MLRYIVATLQTKKETVEVLKVATTTLNIADVVCIVRLIVQSQANILDIVLREFKRILFLIVLSKILKIEKLAEIVSMVLRQMDPVIGGSLLLTYTTGYIALLLLAASFAGALQIYSHIPKINMLTPIFDPPTFKFYASLGHYDRCIEVEGARGRLRSVVGRGQRARGTTGGVFAFRRSIGTKCQSGRSLAQGGRGGKAGEGSMVASRVEVALPEQKRPTSSNCKNKMDQNNPQPKRKRAKQANESDVQLGETGMEHEGATSFVGDRYGLTPRGKSREGTELSHTPKDSVVFEDNAIDIKVVDSSSTSSHAEDKKVTSFLALDVALRFMTMPKTNVTTENAIATANAVIAFLFGVEEEEEDMVTGTTTHNDGATTPTTAAMAPQTSVEHASKVRG